MPADSETAGFGRVDVCAGNLLVCRVCRRERRRNEAVSSGPVGETGARVIGRRMRFIVVLHRLDNIVGAVGRARPFLAQRELRKYEGQEGRQNCPRANAHADKLVCSVDECHVHQPAAMIAAQYMINVVKDS